MLQAILEIIFAILVLAMLMPVAIASWVGLYLLLKEWMSK